MKPETKAKVLRAIQTRTVEDGDCLIWQGGCSRSGTKTGRRPPLQPAIWVEDATHPLRRLAYVAYGGAPIRSDRRISPKCGNDLCLAEEHLVQRTRSQSTTGIRRMPATRARIAAVARARSPLDWDKVRAIRASDKTDRELAAEYSVHFSTISLIRRYRSWIEPGLFSGLMPRDGQGASR